MTLDDSQTAAAQEFILSAFRLIQSGAKEEVVRSNFASHLRSMFPDAPNWLEEHIQGGEATVQIGQNGLTRTRFIDNLVGLTTIEYEPNLTTPSSFQRGLEQVQEHCAGLLRRGEDRELIIGILSDTVRWYAYAIEEVDDVPLAGLEARHVHLRQIDDVDASAGDEIAAKKLLEFVQKHLERLESRPLSAVAISKDLGFTSAFCRQHLASVRQLVDDTFDQDPGYADLIEELWRKFVAVGHGQDATDAFSRDEYTNELYLVTLAKLICANVSEERALLSDDGELTEILNGDFFEARGLLNLVEYDYFGWLSASPDLLPIASLLQEDLRAYNFAQIPAEDLFGQIMAQLADKSRRILLGQEWTPNWLARAIVEHTISLLPRGETPRFVDMCCGSGAMVVEVVRQTMPIVASQTTGQDRVDALSQAVTGFDIDPLAVMLAKINWVLAAREWLHPLGAYSVAIPVYHADSLFAATPLASGSASKQGINWYELHLAGRRLDLPDFLISPDFQAAFDELLKNGYAFARTARGGPSLAMDPAIVAEVTRHALASATTPADQAQRTAAEQFLSELAMGIDALERQGKNGIWAFILGNSYRPELVRGQFNGLVSNPPWLTLSKLAGNPYQEVLKQKADAFGIRPAGPAFLHVELATIFLLHAVERYLKDGAAIGCIVPQTILNGAQHHLFRTATFVGSSVPVDFDLEEIWQIAPTTFRNNAVVLFGRKATPAPGHPDPIPGAAVNKAGSVPLQYNRLVRGRRTAWSDRAVRAGSLGFFSPADFRQGADIMPRTLFFHEVTSVPAARGVAQSRLTPIDRATSSIAYAIKDAKKFRSFRISPQVVPDELIFEVLLLNHLTPFSLAAPLQAVLPIQKIPSNGWSMLSDHAVIAKGSGARATMDQIGGQLGATSLADRIEAIWERIDKRRKLSQQSIVPGRHLVFYGTSGTFVCAAYQAVDAKLAAKLIIDQTLNWAQVDDEDEAIYLSGLLNSEAINQTIEEFQPRGAFGPRHIHSLASEATPPYDASLQSHQDVVNSPRRCSPISTSSRRRTCNSNAHSIRTGGASPDAEPWCGKESVDWART